METWEVVSKETWWAEDCGLHLDLAAPCLSAAPPRPRHGRSSRRTTCSALSESARLQPTCGHSLTPSFGTRQRTCGCSAMLSTWPSRVAVRSWRIYSTSCSITCKRCSWLAPRNAQPQERHAHPAKKTRPPTRDTPCTGHSLWNKPTAAAPMPTPARICPALDTPTANDMPPHTHTRARPGHAHPIQDPGGLAAFDHSVQSQLSPLADLPCSP